MTVHENTEVTLGVALPVYNGEAYIRETIESILAQTMTDLRLVISDNASEDSTQEIAKEYAAKDPRILYHRNPENLGITKNAINTLEMCRPCHYVALIGHDDLWEPGYAEKVINMMKSNPTVSLGFSKVIYIDGKGEKNGQDWHMRVAPYLPALSSENRRTRLSVDPPPYFEHGIMRKDCWDPFLLQDWNGIHRDVFMVRGLLIQGPFLVHDEALFFKRIHRQSFSAGREYKRMYGRRKCWQAAKVFRLRFGLNLVETLTCWYSLFRHYKVKKIIRKQWYRLIGLPEWLRRRRASNDKER